MSFVAGEVVRPIDAKHVVLDAQGLPVDMGPDSEDEGDGSDHAVTAMAVHSTAITVASAEVTSQATLSAEDLRAAIAESNADTAVAAVPDIQFGEVTADDLPQEEQVTPAPVVAASSSAAAPSGSDDSQSAEVAATLGAAFLQRLERDFGSSRRGAPPAKRAKKDGEVDLSPSSDPDVESAPTSGAPQDAALPAAAPEPSEDPPQ